MANHKDEGSNGVAKVAAVGVGAAALAGVAAVAADKLMSDEQKKELKEAVGEVREKAGEFVQDAIERGKEVATEAGEVIPGKFVELAEGEEERGSKSNDTAKKKSKSTKTKAA